MDFLVNELTGKRPLLPPDLPMTPEVCAMLFHRDRLTLYC